MAIKPAIDAKTLSVQASSNKKDIGDFPAW